MKTMNGFNYKGYTYTPREDHDDDCVKIWHEFKTESGTVVTCDWSPYEYMTESDIKLWIDLDEPVRVTGGCLTRKDLNWLDRHLRQGDTA